MLTKNLHFNASSHEMKDKVIVDISNLASGSQTKVKGIVQKFLGSRGHNYHRYCKYKYYVFYDDYNRRESMENEVSRVKETQLSVLLGLPLLLC